jgi:hypothetical protein
MTKILIEDSTITKENLVYTILFVFFISLFLPNIYGLSDIDIQNHAFANCSGDSHCASYGSSLGNIYQSQIYGSQGFSLNNHCNLGSTCDNQSYNTLDIIGSQSSIISQGSYSSNICDNSICSNTITNDASINHQDNSKIIQDSFQQNKCSINSECYIIGSLSSSIKDGADNKQISQTLSQENYCFYNSKCYIESTVPETGGSSTQVNLCLLGSDCSNMVANSNLIAISATCSSASSGIKICTPFGFFSMPTNSIDYMKVVQTAITDQSSTNKLPFFNWNQKGSDIEDTENLSDDLGSGISSDTFVYSTQIQQIQNPPTIYNQQQITNNPSNSFDLIGKNNIPRFQDSPESVYNPQETISIEEIQYDKKRDNTIINEASPSSSWKLAPSVESIQDQLQKRLTKNSQTAQTEIGTNQDNKIIMSNYLLQIYYQNINNDNIFNQLDKSLNQNKNFIQNTLNSLLLSNKIS